MHAIRLEKIASREIAMDLTYTKYEVTFDNASPNFSKEEGGVVNRER